MRWTLYSLLCLVLLIASGCATTTVERSPEPVPPPPSSGEPLDEPDRSAERRAALAEEREAAKAVIDRYGHMWEDEDMDTFEEIIAQDPDMIIIGTDTAEYIIGYENFKELRQAQYDSFDNVEFSVNNQNIKLSRDATVAWFTEDFDLFTMAEGSPVHLEGLRVSGVLEKRDGDWKIVQLHTSVPIAGQAAAY